MRIIRDFPVLSLISTQEKIERRGQFCPPTSNTSISPTPIAPPTPLTIAVYAPGLRVIKMGISSGFVSKTVLACAALNDSTLRVTCWAVVPRLSALGGGKGWPLSVVPDYSHEQ